MYRTVPAAGIALNDVPLQLLSVSLFTEVYAPIINGVVASVAGLRAGLVADGVRATIVAPYFPHVCDGDETIVRLPSLPLPTSTGYRLCIPYVSRALRARVANTSVVHVHSPFVTGWLGMNIARRSGIPLVFTYHTRIDEYAHYAPFEPRRARAALIALTRTFANRSDAVIAPSGAMRDRLRALGVRVPIAVVPSSIDGAHFASGNRNAATRAQLGARNEEALVLAVSRVAEEKHLELAIDALAHVDHVHLAIVGDGPHRGALELRALQTGVRDRVTFAGMRDPADLPDIYAAGDALAFTSETETQGLVLAEAMAAGLPVVAVENAVNREMLAGSGRLVPAAASAFGAALAAAATGPRDLVTAAAARDRFSRVRQSAATIDVYRAAAVCRTFGTPVGHHAPEQTGSPR
jgi:1,2-diacylglycerol 3-alpha-glucosyltransferase